MINLKLFSPLFFLVFLTPVQSNQQKALTWNEYGDGVTSSHDYEKNAIMSTEIDFSKAGIKKLYFVIRYSNSESKKRKESICKLGIDGQSIWAFSGQAVKMKYYCISFDDQEGGKGRELTAYPSTGKGLAYIVNLFKQSTKDVIVESHVLTYPVSATGFTAQWNKAGDEAL